MTYPGGKGHAFTHVINQMPPHQVYIETHLGGGFVLANKKPAPILNIGLDLDPEVITFKEPSKSSALRLAFRAAVVVHVFVVDHPSLSLANLPKRGKLILDVLPFVLRGPSRVERASF